MMLAVAEIKYIRHEVNIIRCSKKDWKRSKNDKEVCRNGGFQPKAKEKANKGSSGIRTCKGNPG
ncbi:hypothetical protein F4694_000588 [Bacillus niacini]|uniref:Uncharacterized protein n=1 Tax=Neobacillus niacini TaxID=86668 RepID=A0A852T7S9_9BACI|nr:hypothetical protein [Neobacillus niacini]NYE03869.1 hypothetical protein [Neobacillus niacini]